MIIDLSTMTYSEAEEILIRYYSNGRPFAWPGSDVTWGMVKL